MPIEIPDHLRYRAPVPRHSVGHVPSRYKEPKQYIDPDLYYEALKPANGGHIRTAHHNFQNVTPRYDQPRSASPPIHDPNQTPKIPKSQSILMTEEYKRHKQYASSCGVGNNVQSHWHNQQNMENVVTKRQIVESQQAQQRAAQVKEGATFKTCVKAPSLTFGQLLERREQTSPMRTVNSPSRKAAHSVVMNWVNNGVPIPGKEEALAPTSPRRTKSPEKPVFVTGAHSRPKVPQKYSVVKEEKAVKLLAENLTTARTRSPPRVAYLPPKYQAPPSPTRHRLGSPTRPRSTGNNVVSIASMMSSTASTARSPSRRDPNCPASAFQHSTNNNNNEGGSREAYAIPSTNDADGNNNNINGNITAASSHHQHHNHLSAQRLAQMGQHDTMAALTTTTQQHQHAPFSHQNSEHTHQQHHVVVTSMGGGGAPRVVHSASPIVIPRTLSHLNQNSNAARGSNGADVVDVANHNSVANNTITNNGRAISPTNQRGSGGSGHLRIGGGIPQLTSAALNGRRSTSPVKGSGGGYYFSAQSSTNNGYTSNGSYHSDPYAANNGAGSSNEFLPFSAAPPPQVSRVANNPTAQQPRY